MAQEGKVTVPVKPEPWKEGDRDVPAVLGHDEGQPAYGVAVKAWREGDKLKADLVNIPKEVSDAIKAGAYFQTSAEVYDDTGEAGLPAGGGCMLRRIALLGADIPQVKTLADLPKPDATGNLKGVEIFAVGEHRGCKYTESDLDNMVANFQRYSAPAVKFSADSKRHKIVLYRKHSEVAMDRSRIIDALVAAGMDKGTAEAMDDGTLQALSPVCDKLSPGSVPPGAALMADDANEDDAPATPPADDVAKPDVEKNDEPPADAPPPDATGFDRTAIIAQLVGNGLDANELNALSDDDLKKRLEQVNAVSKNADDPADQGLPPDDPMTTPGPQASGSAAPIQKLSAKKYAEKQISALHSQLEKAKQQIDATLAQSAKDVKAAKFETFKEKLRASGRLVPSMEEGGLLDDFVASLDHSTVRKFGEGKKTQFDMLQEILDRLPRVVKYGETMKSSERGVIKLAETTADDGESVVRARYRQFSEKFRKMGFKEEEAVEAFKRRKAKDPLLTADDYLKV